MQISLEITESMLKDNKKDAIDKLEILKDLGFSISIDDFGTGYSNFSSIGKTWVSVLKIDRSFIAHLENIKNMRLVEGIIKTAHDLEIKVVAE